MRRITAILSAFLLTVSIVLVQPAPAAAASRQLCHTITHFYNSSPYYPARVCVNYIPAIRPTGYYLVESTRVWNPCNPFPMKQYSIMKFWTNTDAYHSVYTGAITCGQTYVKTWPNPRVDNADYVYFAVDSELLSSRCVHLRPPTWEFAQDINVTGSC